MSYTDLMSFTLYDTLNSLLMAVFVWILWQDACWNTSEESEMDREENKRHLEGMREEND